MPTSISLIAKELQSYGRVIGRSSLTSREWLRRRLKVTQSLLQKSQHYNQSFDRTTKKQLSIPNKSVYRLKSTVVINMLPLWLKLRLWASTILSTLKKWEILSITPTIFTWKFSKHLVPGRYQAHTSFLDMPIIAFSSTLVKEHKSLLKNFSRCWHKHNIAQNWTCHHLGIYNCPCTLHYKNGNRSVIIHPDHWDDDWVSF